MWISDGPSMYKTYFISSTEESLAKVSWRMRTRNTIDGDLYASMISILNCVGGVDIN